MAHVVYMPAEGRGGVASRSDALEFCERAFGVQLFVLIFLQKFVLPLGSGIPISLPLVTLYVWLAYMALAGRLDVSGWRLALAGVLFAAATISEIFAPRASSLLSFLQFLMLYAPFVFVWRVSGERYLRLAAVFQNFMTVGAAMVFLQLFWQAVFGLGRQPNLEEVIPRFLLLDGYNYQAPIAWGQAFVRPNGYFFLEPSFCSAFLATAVIIELMFFHRVWRVLLYGAALLGTVAVTGLLLVAIAIPLVLVIRRDLRAAIGILFASAIGGAAAYATGTLEHVLGRFTELASPGSSGWERLIAPTLQLRSVYNDSTNVFSGVGAGNSVEMNVSLWPLAKVAVEYGAFAAAIFFIYMAVAMGRSVNRPLAIGLFVIFNFTGGFLLMPVTVIQILMLVTLLQLPRVAQPRGGEAEPEPSPRARAVVITPRRPVPPKEPVRALRRWGEPEDVAPAPTSASATDRLRASPVVADVSYEEGSWRP